MSGPGDHRQAMGRRRFLSSAVAVAGGALFGFGELDALVARQARAASGLPVLGEQSAGGYGALAPLTRADPMTGFRQTLWLPAGFDFAVFGLAGSALDDGSLTPLAHDGMAAFPGPGGTTRLVRNHEDRNSAGRATASGPDPRRRYDARGGGGTSTLQIGVDRRGGRVLERAWMSLAGTIVNCAGGPTPWGSWLSCEETTEGTRAGWAREHGYVFEVSARGEGLVEPVPLPALGRFVHEAAAVDPGSGIVYETEDRGAAGFYRFVPDRPGNLRGGLLQMLRIVGEPDADTRTGQQPGSRRPVEWVTIDNPDPGDAETNPMSVFEQGLDRGGATFARIEGCWWGEGAVYFCCTNGGDVGEGQVWEYRPSGTSGGTLALVYESPGVEELSFPDNITVTPRGALLLCEDTDRRDDFYLQGLTREGRVFSFCGADTGGEWAGATYSPDGQTLFVNLQGETRGDPANPGDPGRTLAIWGPWGQGVL